MFLAGTLSSHKDANQCLGPRVVICGPWALSAPLQNLNPTVGVWREKGAAEKDRLWHLGATFILIVLSNASSVLQSLTWPLKKA